MRSLKKSKLSTILAKQNNKKSINLKNIIGLSYYKQYKSIKNNKHTHYWNKGGRGSLKSSFISIVIPLLIMIDAKNKEFSNAVIMRKVFGTCRDSVYTQLKWGINILGASSKWHGTISPLALTYLPTGQKILFRGSANQDDYEKIKSLKFENGFCKYVWFEETTEFYGIDEINNILQSLLRGENNDYAKAFYSYNPPASKTNWVNEEAKTEREDRLIQHSTYLEADPNWLGKIFIKEAEHIKKINFKKYQHIYLGEEVGEGLEIYQNVTFRTITNDEIMNFTNIDRGFDFGYSHSSCYSEVYYNEKEERIFILDEVYSPKLKNKRLFELVYPKAGKRIITGDSEDPRLINELCDMGLNVHKAIKGKDSKNHGIKWVSDRTEIIIDKKRTPCIAHDFSTYEKKKDKEGKIIEDYPKEPDGSASVRYALEKYMLNRKIRVLKGLNN